MIPALKVIVRMGSLQVLAPFFLFGVALCFVQLSVWVFIAILYGFFLQFFVEYSMHRFLYHRKPPKDQSPFNALYRSHIAHHEFPNDPEYFTGDDHWFAVRFGLISAAIHSLILWPFFGLVDAVTLSIIALFVGSVASFAFYEYCHTLAHLKVEKGPIGRAITRSHLAHHFQDHQATYHVSFGMGWIDRLFGTQHDPEEAKTRFDRKTMLSLGMDPEDLRLVTARKAFGITKSPARSNQ